VITVDDLSPGGRLPAPITVTVTNIETATAKSRHAVVEVVDSAGNELRIVDCEGENISVDWRCNRQYRISQCGVNEGGGNFEVELAPNMKTDIERVDPVEDTTQLLVIGDTHVGRRTHPDNGEKIDPLGALSTAVKHGIEQDVTAVIHVGDLFHESATPVQEYFVDQRVFKPLRDAGIPFYYVSGNHESGSENEPLKEAVDNPAINLDLQGTTVGDDVCLYGIDHYKMGNIPWNDLQFPNQMDESVSILVLHQTLRQLSGAGPKSVNLNQIRRRVPKPFDFVVSGHHHGAIRKTWNGTTVLYTGAVEKMNTNSDPVDRVAWFSDIENGDVLDRRYDIP
jgi:predicted phosphodiesterase